MPGYLEAYRLSRAQAQEPEPAIADDNVYEDTSTPVQSPTPASKRKPNLKSFEKAKLDLDKGQEVNEPKFAKDKVRMWQQSGEDLDPPDQEQNKPATKQAARQRAKTVANPKISQDPPDDSNDNSSPAGPKTPARIGGISVEIRAASTPKRRIVSDEHWLNDRPSPDAPQTSSPKPKVSPTAGGTGFLVRSGSAKPEAWVRRKSTPKKAKPEVLKEGVEINANVEDASGNATKDKITPTKKRGSASPANLVKPESNTADQPDITGVDGSSSTKENGPNEPPEKPVTPKKEPPKRVAQVRRRSTPKAAAAPKSPADQEGEPKSETTPTKTFTGRLQAWLAQTPDPSVEKLDDPFPDDSSPNERSKSQPLSPIQSDSEDQSAHSSSTLKRSGARRGAQSPIKKHRSASEQPRGPTQKDPQKSRSAEQRNLRDIDGNITAGKSRRNRASMKKSFGKSLTSHADLISALSQPYGVKGLVSAATIRTARRKVNESTLTDIADELKSDESKYLRELRTLVDGVIPVLINSVLNRSNSRANAELVEGLNEVAITKDIIIDLGIALERLLSMHTRIPIYDIDGLVSWAERSCSVYQNYIAAWKLGFQDMVVNLAPGDAADDTGAAAWNRGHKEDPFASKGDGEHVDVAFLLKRPLVRIKYLTKTLKAIDHVRPSKQAATWAAKFQDLVDDARWKQDKERARLEDEAASNIDVTRTRDPQTLAPLPGVRIKRGRCVAARDMFNLKLIHSSGQRLDCHVMLIMRDDASGAKSGDVLICEVDNSSRWLLLPPVEFHQISARRSSSKRDIVVMIRGFTPAGQEWWELLSLEAESQDAAIDWVEMLGSHPLPPSTSAARGFKNVVDNGKNANTGLTLASPERPRALTPKDLDVPLGEQSVLSSKITDVDSRDYARRREFVTNKPESSGLSRFDRERDSGAPPNNDQRYKGARNSYSKPSFEPVSFEGSRRETSQAPEKVEANNSKVRQWLTVGYDPPKPEYGAAQPETHINHEDYSQMDVLRKGSTQRAPLPRRLSTVPSEGLIEGLLSLSLGRTRTGGDNARHSLPSTPRRAEAQPKALAASANSSPVQLRGSSTPQFTPKMSQSNDRRRSSSPLKYEYAPSSGSDKSSVRGALRSDDEGSVTSESSVDDLGPDPQLPVGRLHSLASKYVPIGRQKEAPQPTIPQGLHQSLPQEPAEARKVIASIYSWSDKGIWELLHPDECSIVVSPGLIEAFKMSAAHSAEPGAYAPRGDGRAERPLVAQELTPLVPLRQSTAIDISIRSPATPNSRLRSGSNIMFRSRTGPECEFLYSLINQARINNPTFIALQNARGPAGGSNWASFMDRQANTRGARSWWRLGSRKSSYRASNTKRSASLAETMSSVATKSSAMSALRRFSGGSKMFNVAKSTISSRGALSRSSGASHESADRQEGGVVATIDPSQGSPAGLTDMKIRLYEREMASKWRDMGSAQLTIMHPPGPPGGVITPTGHLKQEKRIVITGKTRGETLLDVTLGETSFERVARTGIAIKVWEQFDQMAKTGGVMAARVRVYMIQMKSEAEAAYTFSLVGRLRY